MLELAAGFWFVVAFIGQIIFAGYVLGFYGFSAARGDFTAWNKVLPHGYVAGDTFGNLVIGGHLLLAVIVTLCGPLQLIPHIRNFFPAFHRWNGRIYLTTVTAIAIGGLYMGLTRRLVGDFPQHVALGINGVLILIFAALALRHAMARNLVAHRRWALRLILAASGVWFFRVGLMFWIVVNQGPVGFDFNTFTGPFLTILAFAQFLLPLAMLELYFHAQRVRRSGLSIATAVAMGLLALAMGLGIFGATVFLWLPRL